ncbi:MAG: UDP-N-acetylglucosamine 2-epimerase [Candidatus Woesearchaeota archaeon]|nr:UDP-N-acetylglucosamine 2-epimerase [Candidatus Woesearchaeota archaeon]
MKGLVLVSEPRAAKRLRGKNWKGNQAEIVSLNDASSGALRKNGISFKTINDFISDKEAREINHDSIFWLRDWSEKSGIKKITYKNISLWWFFDFWLYHSFFKWDMMKNIAWYVSSINRIIQKTKPDKVIVFGDSVVTGITRQIRPDAKAVTYRKFNIKSPRIVDIGVNMKHCIRKCAARIIYRDYRPEKRDVMFASYASWFRPCIKEYGKTEKEDVILGYLQRRSAERYRYNVLATDIDFTTKLGIRVMKEKRDKRSKYTDVPFEYYFTRKTDGYARLLSKDVMKQWKKFDDRGKNEAFRKSLVYEGVNIYDYVKPLLDFVFRKRICSAIRYIETAIDMLDKEKPRLLLVADETALFGRCLISAAKTKGIPVIAVQHGYITPNSFEYMHAKGEISRDLSIEKPFCPVADRIVVYGPYTKDILVRSGNYPEHSVVVTGQPRYDCLANKKAFSREKVFDDFGLDKKKKLILWTTQDIPGQIEIVFNAVKNIKNAQLLVKVHPREVAGADLYHKKAKESGMKIWAVKEANALELINACDVMITMHSTTGLEAIMMNKPVVVLNMSGKPDIVPYAQEGAAIGVYKADHLEPAIRNALFDSKKRAALLKESKAYSFRHAYKMDGNATERVLKVIGSMIK